jgi:plasmid stability protein
MHDDAAVKLPHIRAVPEQTIERPKRRAMRHHRSLQGELQVMLAEAAKQVAPDDNARFALKTVRTQGPRTGRWGDI